TAGIDGAGITDAIGTCVRPCAGGGLDTGLVVQTSVVDPVGNRGDRRLRGLRSRRPSCGPHSLLGYFVGGSGLRGGGRPANSVHRRLVSVAQPCPECLAARRAAPTPVRVSRPDAGPRVSGVLDALGPLAVAQCRGCLGRMRSRHGGGTAAPEPSGGGCVARDGTGPTMAATANRVVALPGLHTA